VDPSAQGRGLGRFLTLLGLEHLSQRLSDQDDPTVILYVESDNTAALKTYQGLGFVPVTVDTSYAAV
jgi:mycothiol synthase